ncbi:MAG: hypothetical protein M0011_01555 [Elusimicrobia bacterium]|nr:hypothetical protein [Elusimicrobiota bacterium]
MKMKKKYLTSVFALLFPAVSVPAVQGAETPPGQRPGMSEYAAARKARREAFRKDPVRMEISRLGDLVRTTKDPKEKETATQRISELSAALSVAEAEAGLTPAQKAERAEKGRRKEALRAELAPLLEKLKTVSGEERASVLARIREVKRKYE